MDVGRLRDHARPAERGASAGRAGTGPETRPEPEARAESAAVRELLGAARDFFGMGVAWLGRIRGSHYELVEIDGDLSVLGGAVRGTVVELDRTFCRETMLHGGPLLIQDLDAPHNGPPRPGHPELRSYVGIPVVLADQTAYGTLCLGDRTATPELDDRHRRLIRLFARAAADAIDRARLRDVNRRLAARLDAEHAASEALAAALDVHDHYTAAHSRTMVGLADGVATAMGLEPEDRAMVRQVALLHDVGKVGLPDAVLRGGELLDEDEWRLVREHPVLGQRIVSRVEALAHLGPAIRAEHERFDGGGYPDGLVGAAIPVASRIVLACDAWSAMRSDRSYRVALSSERARAELVGNAGSQFDPRVVEALLGVLDADETDPRSEADARE